MVVDSSVLLQILFQEPGAEGALRALGSAPTPKMSAPTLLETETVYGSVAGFGSGAVLELVDRLEIEVLPFTLEHAREARLAYARYSKGQGHPARLNFGECISYALARLSGEPLAFKGDDFSQTDLRAVRLG
jgi:ribonuclease VapC